MSAIEMGRLLFLSNPVSTLGRASHKRRWLDPGCLFVQLADRFGRRVGFVACDQRHRAATETTAGHARANYALGFAGQFDQNIQLLAADLEIVAQRIVTGIHQR